MKKIRIDNAYRRETEVSTAMQGLFRTAVSSCGRRFTGLLVLALMVLAIAVVFTPSSVYAAGTNQITGATDSSPKTMTDEPIKTGKDVLMVTITTNKGAQGADLTKAIVSLAGSNLQFSMVDAVIANYASAGGPESAGEEDGRTSKPSTLDNIAVFLDGNTIGGETWYFYLELNDDAVAASEITFTVKSMTGSNNANLPFTTAQNGVQIGCDAVAPSDVTLESKTDSSITLDWSINTNNDKYVLYRNAGGGYKIYNGNVPLSEIPYTDAGIGASNSLYPLTKYAYLIRGYSVGCICESKDSNILITQTKSDNKFQIYTCGGCHTTPPDDAPVRRGTPDGGTIGRHANPYHTGGVMEGTEVCVKCHVEHTEPAHRDKKIAMNTTAIFGYPNSFYDKNRNYVNVPSPEAGIDTDFEQSNFPIHVDNVTLPYPKGNGFCVNTWCHGSRGASPVWGYSSGNSQCTICHGMADGEPSYDTEGDTSPSDEQVGAHNKHLHLGNYVGVDPSGFLNISTVNPCSECHITPTAHEDAQHYDTGDPAEVTFGPIATNGSVISPVYSSDNGTCTNTYCHDGRNFKNAWADASNVTVPTWDDSTYLDSGGNTFNCQNRCHGYPPKLPHEQDNDCSGCHEHLKSDDISYKPEYYYKHIDGVVQGMNCTDCHGKPPTDLASMVNDTTKGRTGRTWNYANAWGQHSDHDAAGFGCEECHQGGKPTSGQHNDQSPTFINVGFAAGSQYGEYTAPQIENSTYYALGQGGSTTLTVSGTATDPRTCDNIYCHSDGSNYDGTYTFTQADWDDAASATCGSCHPEPPTNDGHNVHTSTSNYGFTCYECHADTVQANKTVIGNHVNEVKDVEFANLASGADPYGTPTAGKCSNFYCHSDGKASPQYATTPEWNLNTTCVSCHGGAYNVTGGAGTSLGDAHAEHLDATGYRCTDCHNNVVSATNTITDYSLHVDDLVNVAVMAANGGDGTNYSGGSCSSTNCHGTNSPDWTDVSGTGCNICHGTDSSTGAVPPDTGGSSSATDDEVGAHSLHLQATSTIANTDFLPRCGNCHTVPSAVGDSGHIDSTQPAEVNFAFNATDFGNITTANYDSASHTCENVYCHNTAWAKNSWGGGANGNIPYWSDTAYLTGSKANDCTQCHGNPPTNISHEPDTNCNECHTHVNTNNDGFADKGLHMDHVVQGKGCDGCHGYPPISDATMVNSASDLKITGRTANYSNAWGAHDFHYTTLSISCDNCHKGGKKTTGGQHSGTGTSILNIGIVVYSVQQGIYQAPAFENTKFTIQGYGGTTYTEAGTYSNSDPRTCANTYCHGTSSPRWSYLAGSGCTNCHGDKTAYRDTGNSTNPTDDEVGAHSAHLTAPSGYTNTVGCGECHNVPTQWDNTGHVDDYQPAEVPLEGGMAQNGSAFGLTYYDTDQGTCSNIYCHDTTYLSGGDGGSAPTPAWTNIDYLNGNPTNDCTRCHGWPPASTHTTETNCSSCHTHLNTDDVSFSTWGNINLHMDGTLQGGCDTCHGQAPSSDATMVNSASDLKITGRTANYSNAWGQHTIHNTSVDMGCPDCHKGGKNTGGNEQHNDPTATILNIGIIRGGTATTVYQAPAFENTAYTIRGYGGTTYTEAGTYTSADPRTCGNTWCHGTSSPRWNDSSGTGCNICHGTDSSTGAVPPDTGNSSLATDDEVGAHAVHLQATSTIANTNYLPRCGNCHTVPSQWYSTGHIDSPQPAEVNFASNATDFGNIATANYDSLNHTCENVYCHNTAWAKNSWGGGANGNIPDWTDTAYIGGGSDCSQCHGWPPSNAGHQQDTNCNGCHSHVDSDDNESFDAGQGNKALHIDHVVQGKGCDGCHGQAPSSDATMVNSASSLKITGRTANYSNAWGQHTIHNTSVNMGCPDCHKGGKNTGGNEQHNNPTATILNIGIIEGGTATTVYQAPAFENTAYTIRGYGGTTYTEAGTYTSADPRTCGNTWCHGTSSPRWNDSSGTGCNICHGTNSSTGAVPPDTGNSSLATDDEVGAHAVHLQATSTIANTNYLPRCGNCHTVPSQWYSTGHIDSAQPAEVNFASNATDFGNIATANYDSLNHTCENVYCHNTAWAKNSWGGGANGNIPDWTDTAYIGGGSDCSQCHGWPPSNAGHDPGTNCNNCHTHVDSDDNESFDQNTGNKALHIDHRVQGGGGCTGCHNSVKNGRRATVTELGYSVGHVQGSVEDTDCYPCHMEAKSDGKPDTTNGYHESSAGDGVIQLRDPNTGGYNASLVFTDFSRALSSAPETINQNISEIFCLGCHDSGGSVAYVSGGSTTNPWNDGGVTVMNVDSHFNTSNASWHPIKATQNNAFCDTDTMSAPWGNSHYKMTCFDCHATPGASGTQTSTMIHGDTSGYLRAAYSATGGNATPLCVECHLATVYWGSTTHDLSENSALNATNDDSTWGTWHAITETGYYGGCTVCHGTTGYPTTMPSGAAERAENVHGFNELVGGGNWPLVGVLTGGQSTRPYAFIRNKNNWGTVDGGSMGGGWNIGTGSGTAKGLCGNMCTSRDYTYGPTGTY